jgi:cytochrome c peroxidase
VNINTHRAYGISASRRAGLHALLGGVALVLMQAGATSWADDGQDGMRRDRDYREVQTFPDPTGFIETYNVNGAINRHGAFFQPLGTNGRSCETCHAADQAMSISPPQIRALYEQTRGRDPLFAAVDGANCSNVERGDRRGHSLLLQHGLIRIPVTLPANPQFTITVVHDPYGCALTTDPGTGQLTASVYRRPLPTTNLNFLSTIMFDGRETISPLNSGSTFLANLTADLTHQATSAINVHFQASSAPTAQQLQQIVQFELGLFTAQTWDRHAGALNDNGAGGGARNLGEQQYYPGINDVLGADPTGTPFDSSSMTLFNSWAHARGAHEDARQAIAAGEVLFNTAPLTITNVRGLNDSPALGKPTSFKGTCTTCHDAPNVGDHSLPLPLDIGIGHSPLPGLESDPAIASAIAELDEPRLPVFLIQGCPNPFNAGQPESFYTTDPGKGLVTGQCGDINRVKGPVLRGLAARAPYFHNGAAATLLEAVNFYNQRFAMNLTAQQKQELVAFLNSL